MRANCRPGIRSKATCFFVMQSPLICMAKRLMEIGHHCCISGHEIGTISSNRQICERTKSKIPRRPFLYAGADDGFASLRSCNETDAEIVPQSSFRRAALASQSDGASPRRGDHSARVPFPPHVNCVQSAFAWKFLGDYGLACIRNLMRRHNACSPASDTFGNQ